MALLNLNSFGDWTLFHVCVCVCFTLFGVQVYLVHILSRLPEIKSPQQFSESLYRSRFQQLYPQDGLYLQRNWARKNGFQCLKDRPKDIMTVIDKYGFWRLFSSLLFFAVFLYFCLSLFLSDCHNLSLQLLCHFVLPSLEVMKS